LRIGDWGGECRAWSSVIGDAASVKTNAIVAGISSSIGPGSSKASGAVSVEVVAVLDVTGVHSSTKAALRVAGVAVSVTALTPAAIS